MITRKLQSPGIEINEIDRSQYNKVDYSLPNAPTSLVFGFASKGEDATFKWINSKPTLDEVYGQPTTEFEAYFYNAIIEILNRGGTCIASKLPYMNEAYEKFNYVEYKIGELLPIANLDTDISIDDTSYKTIDDIRISLNSLLSELGDYYDTSTIIRMAQACEYIYNKYLNSHVDTIATINNIKEALVAFINAYKTDSSYADLYLNDSNLTSYFDITFVESKKDTIDNFDNYITKTKAVMNDRIRIYDISRSQYQTYNSTDAIIQSQVTESSQPIPTNDFLGIIPVIVTPYNAMFFQNILQHSSQLSNLNYDLFNSVGSITTVYNANINNEKLNDIDNYSSIPLKTKPFNVDVSNEPAYNNVSLSRLAALQFPSITYNGYSHFDATYLKQIGIVVLKAYKDVDNNGKVNYQLLESFVGSLDKKAKDEISHNSIFIDDIVNTNSKYIRLFSNVNQTKVVNASTIVMSNQSASSLGFYQIDTAKNIHFINSITKPLTYLLDNASNKYTIDLDLVIDAGISNIAHLAKLNNNIIYTNEKPRLSDYSFALIGNPTSDNGWVQILQKFDNFCKNMRKDCMFIADGLRSFCLDGDVKYIRKTAPQNTVTNSIINKLKYMTNVLNSSYSAGYCNWFYQYDYSNTYDYLWVPPSIKAAGVYIHCDIYAHPWSAPAGMIRGVIRDAIDIAFTPLEADAGQIYNNEWNYAMNYPLDGIVIEGHKTFQMQRTALDRINVRRLLIWLEKQVLRVARRFVYEGNTPYLRQLFVDTIRPIFEQAISGSGILEYGIKCDDELNTPQVIENNELRCKIAVKPVKVVDWIVIDLISTRQSANISEELIK